jgi:hypothetical protein
MNSIFKKITFGYLGFGTGRGGTFKITITASNTN